MKYEVIPHNGRKSFYGKAIVTEVDGSKTLTSYTTDVARIDKEGHFIKLWNGYSVTTMNHVNAFRIMNELNALTKKEWESMETEETEKPHSDMTWQQSYKAIMVRRNAG